MRRQTIMDEKGRNIKKMNSKNKNKKKRQQSDKGKISGLTSSNYFLLSTLHHLPSSVVYCPSFPSSSSLPFLISSLLSSSFLISSFLSSSYYFSFLALTLLSSSVTYFPSFSLSFSAINSLV